MIEAYNLRLKDQHTAMRHQTYLLMLPNLNGMKQEVFNRDFWCFQDEEIKISKDLQERYNRAIDGNKRITNKGRG